jgi:hypothetical protein
LVNSDSPHPHTLRFSDMHALPHSRRITRTHNHSHAQVAFRILTVTLSSQTHFHLHHLALSHALSAHSQSLTLKSLSDLSQSLSAHSQSLARSLTHTDTSHRNVLPSAWHKCRAEYWRAFARSRRESVAHATGTEAICWALGAALFVPSSLARSLYPSTLPNRPGPICVCVYIRLCLCFCRQNGDWTTESAFQS